MNPTKYFIIATNMKYGTNTIDKIFMSMKDVKQYFISVIEGDTYPLPTRLTTESSVEDLMEAANNANQNDPECNHNEYYTTIITGTTTHQDDLVIESEEDSD
jgi:hypothetical protein